MSTISNRDVVGMGGTEVVVCVFEADLNVFVFVGAFVVSTISNNDVVEGRGGTVVSLNRVIMGLDVVILYVGVLLVVWVVSVSCVVVGAWAVVVAWVVVGACVDVLSHSALSCSWVGALVVVEVLSYSIFRRRNSWRLRVSELPEPNSEGAVVVATLGC